MTIRYRRFVPPAQPLLRIFFAFEPPETEGSVYYAVHVSSVLEREQIVATHGREGYARFLRGIRRKLARQVAERTWSVRSATEPIDFRAFDQLLHVDDRKAIAAQLIEDGAR